MIKPFNCHLHLKVDFGDFQFLRVEPKVVRYVSGVATALLGSGEFSNEEYKAAKVDPIAQFSKPVATHMNKDHADDTKVIVQHSTSIPLKRGVYGRSGQSKSLIYKPIRMCGLAGSQIRAV
ncbi:FMN-binding split barrel [Parasponia andersonii]|uniref:FMN-binding split barrel n=1 Tax=Parasponia andersonii TaxID=3476 RepID=A0A2P5A7N1_PARAD|nr:FMN-binding split barrel [Parasponia andersonii]